MKYGFRPGLGPAPALKPFFEHTGGTEVYHDHLITLTQRRRQSIQREFRATDIQSGNNLENSGSTRHPIMPV